MIYCPACHKPHNFSRLYGEHCSESCQEKPPLQPVAERSPREVMLFLDEHGFSTARELAEHMRVTTAQARKVLEGLSKQGFVEQVYGLTALGVTKVR